MLRDPEITVDQVAKRMDVAPSTGICREVGAASNRNSGLENNEAADKSTLHNPCVVSGSTIIVIAR